MMSKIHFVLQGKGGVGKTLISSFLLQYFSNNDIPAEGIDCDPANATLSGYEALPVKRINVMSEDSNIDMIMFDDVMDALLSSDVENIVLDCGASVFIPILSYMKENGIVELLLDNGKSVYLHNVISGGQGIMDTLNGLETLLATFDTEESKKIIWVNRFFGKVEVDGKTFEEFKIYKKNASKIDSLIYFPNKNAQTFGRDLQELFTRRKTFLEAADDPKIALMARQRLKLWWNEMCESIDKANLFQE